MFLIGFLKTEASSAARMSETATQRDQENLKTSNIVQLASGSQPIIQICSHRLAVNTASTQRNMHTPPGAHLSAPSSRGIRLFPCFHYSQRLWQVSEGWARKVWSIFYRIGLVMIRQASFILQSVLTLLLPLGLRTWTSLFSSKNL